MKNIIFTRSSIARIYAGKCLYMITRLNLDGSLAVKKFLVVDIAA